MITEAQRQEYIARGYDIIFEMNNQVFVVNSSGVASWDNEKKEKFCNATGLDIVFEKGGNPVFYDPKYFEVDRSILHYIGLITKNIPQPINCRCMHSMFANDNLKALDLSDWDVSGVRSINSMFHNCNKLQSVNISTWNVSNIMDADSVFENCYQLCNLDLSCWKVRSDITSDAIFEHCYMLCIAYGMNLGYLEQALKDGNWPKPVQPQKISI